VHTDTDTDAESAWHRNKNNENKLTELAAEMAEQKTSGPFTVVCKDSFE